MGLCSTGFSFLGALEALCPAPRHNTRYGRSSAHTLGPEAPISSTAAQACPKPALRGTLEKIHLLVLVEFSCTFHFEYDLVERFAQHYLTRPTVLF